MKKVTKRIFEDEKSNEAIRINKYLSDSGICSRREADSYIEKGKVLIDGEVAVMGSKVLPGQKVTFLGKDINREEKMVLIAFNKPKGIVCTTDKREPDNIIDFIKYGSRIYPIGRLDKDSEGLILLTNNGDIVNKILRAGNNHEKEYIVRVNQPITTSFLKSMSEGVPILDTVTKPCTIEAIDKFRFRIILRQGLNRQIRRMCEYLGYRVLELQRIRIMNVNLGRLQLGGYRNLTDRELEELRVLLQESSNLPASDEIDDEMVDVRFYDKNINKESKRNSSGKARNKAKNFNREEDNIRKSPTRTQNGRETKGPSKNPRGRDGKTSSYGKDSSNRKGNSYEKDSRNEKASSYRKDSSVGKSTSVGKDSIYGKSTRNDNATSKSKSFSNRMTSENSDKSKGVSNAKRAFGTSGSTKYKGKNSRDVRK